MLGSIPCHRGGATTSGLATLSFDSGAEEFASLVTENTEKTIKALFYTFDAKDHPLRLRAWRSRRVVKLLGHEARTTRQTR